VHRGCPARGEWSRGTPESRQEFASNVKVDRRQTNSHFTQNLCGFLAFLVVHSLPMASFDPDTAIDCLRRMEETVLGLKQVRGLLPNSPARELLDALIVEAEEHIAEVKRKAIQ